MVWRCRRVMAVVVVALTLVVPVPGCLDDGMSEASTIILYGFSVKSEALDGAIIPAFKEHWRNETGRDVEFKTTYAGSGKITNQVIAGAPAQVMVLSTEWDALELRREGRTETEWNPLPHNGTLSRSPWVIMTRAGNPRGITDFGDLAGADVEIVHADPLTSGGARWSIFSIYGSVLKKTTESEGRPNATAAEALVEAIVGNVISWQSSARKALSQFDLGYGDVLITYECEALLMRAQGHDYEIVYPESTILSEHKVVIIDANVDEGDREVVDAFVAFLHSDVAQGCLADHHFRSVDDDINAAHPEFPDIGMPFTIDYLGGWEAAQAELIEGLFMGIRG